MPVAIGLLVVNKLNQLTVGTHFRRPEHRDDLFRSANAREQVICAPLYRLERFTQLVHLLVPVAILDNAPTQLRYREGSGEGEFQIGSASLVVTTAQILSLRANALLAGCLPPCESLQKP